VGKPIEANHYHCVLRLKKSQPFAPLQKICRRENNGGQPCIFFAKLSIAVLSKTFFPQACQRLSASMQKTCKAVGICRLKNIFFASLPTVAD
jgi:hypothetical protein